ncbi:hypothetical protein HHL28_11005 [Aerophototrophica crusticola]|uniref:Uncharacterized protein n=1 Tax=Aerophototrophica crusticola TaxID=1709002 RepID=A0A858R850_9PROT|nr:hypothetical protein HHL28_11005 [Rhodospirillaceae bacterium B3]
MSDLAIPFWLGDLLGSAEAASLGITACPMPIALAERVEGLRPYPLLESPSDEVDMTRLPGMPSGQVVLPLSDSNIHNHLRGLFAALRARGIDAIYCIGCVPTEPAHDVVYRYPTTEALADALHGRFQLSSRIYLDEAGTFIAQDLHGDFLQIRAARPFLQEVLGPWDLTAAMAEHLAYLRISTLPDVQRLASEIEAFNSSVPMAVGMR